MLKIYKMSLVPVENEKNNEIVLIRECILPKIHYIGATRMNRTRWNPLLKSDQSIWKVEKLTSHLDASNNYIIIFTCIFVWSIFFLLLYITNLCLSTQLGQLPFDFFTFQMSTNSTFILFLHSSLLKYINLYSIFFALGQVTWTSKNSHFLTTAYHTFGFSARQQKTVLPNYS